MTDFIVRFLKRRLTGIIFWCFCIGVFTSIMLLYGLQPVAVLYPVLICIIAGVIYLICAAFSEYKREKEDERLKRLSEEIKKERAPDTESIEYFTLWAHQIKTPIASMCLKLKNEDSGKARALLSDLLHIEQYVDMALTYLKMEKGGSDYVFKEISVDDVIRDCVKRLRGDFILKGLSLNFTETGFTVVTDEKWLSFIIEQVLSNSIKYTNEGEISIYPQEPYTLVIMDTGVGIAPEDLPLVFEKGYTGLNGRQDKRASGLGLYLCKKICTRLGFLMDISSYEGTTVELRLTKM